MGPNYRPNIIRDFSFNGNQYTGGKNSFGKMMNQKYVKAGRLLGSVGTLISVYQCVNASNVDEQLEFGLDAVIGAAGVLFPEEFGIASTIWFCGGKQLTYWYSQYVITPMIDEGINPGLMFDRGYTGHEHLTDFGLINMNGRVYDPAMSSFLSADRFVQDPLTAQGFNRYAYCLYNPLRYVDPTGWLAIGGGRRSSPDDPPRYTYVEGHGGYELNEVTIIADNPSLSNVLSFDEFWYTPNITSGGFDNGWGGTNNSSDSGRSGGGGGGSGYSGQPTQDIWGEIPPEGAVIHTGNMLFFKTFSRYQIGLLNNIGLISEDFWVDASTISINETDLLYRSEYDDYEYKE